MFVTIVSVGVTMLVSLPALPTGSQAAGRRFVFRQKG